MRIAPAVRWHSLQRLRLHEPWSWLVGRAAIVALVAVLAYLAGQGALAFQVLELRQAIETACPVPP